MPRQPKKFDVLIEKAKAAVDSQDYDKAIDLYQAALKISENAEAYKELGNIYYEKYDLELAEKHYLQALNLEPNYWAALLNLGIIAFERQNYTDAIDYLEKSLAANPEHLNTITKLGITYAYIGNFPAAYQHFSQVLERDPNNTICHIEFSQALLLEKRFDKAIAYCQKIIKFLPEKYLTNIHWHLARAYSNKKDTDNAIYYWLKVIEKNPEHKPGLRKLASLYKDKGDYEASFTYHQKNILSSYKEAPSLLFGDIFNLDMLIFSVDPRSELFSKILSFAKKLYEQKNKELEAVYHILIIALSTSKDYENSLRYSKEAKELCPTNNAHFRYLLACNYYFSDQKDEAISELEALIELSPTYLRAYKILSKLYQETSSLEAHSKMLQKIEDEAVPEIEKLIELSPGYIHTYKALSELLQEIGNLEAYEKTLQKIKELEGTK